MAAHYNPLKLCRFLALLTGIALLLIFSASQCRADDISIICHPDIAETALSKSDVKNIFLGKKINHYTKFNIDIPRGYTVKHLPESINIENDLFFINAEIKQIGNQLKYILNVKTNSSFIHREMFNLWNRSLTELKAFYQDQIILKK